MGIVILYEFIRQNLQINAKAVIDEIIEKTQTKHFFTLYDNLNFYENVQNQQLYNWSAFFSYIANYICFMKKPERNLEVLERLPERIDINETWIKQ